MTEFWAGIAKRFSEAFFLETIGDKAGAFIVDATFGIFTFALFYGVWMICLLLIRGVARKGHLDSTTQNFVEVSLKFVILTLGLIQGLKSIGIDTAALIAGLGVMGLTLGFAARDALSNLISGVLIFWDRPFVINDLVEIEGNYGRVDKMTLRSTRVVTPDGRMLAVPNSTIINSIVTSYTNFPSLCISLDFSIGVNVDFNQVRSLLVKTVAQDSAFMSDPAPLLWVTNLGDYANTVTLQAWLINEREHATKRNELRERCYLALSAAQIEMPLETIQLEPVKLYYSE